ncbi:hypothetical protein GCM10009624_35530 [Gordonia sinesedis]
MALLRAAVAVVGVVVLTALTASWAVAAPSTSGAPGVDRGGETGAGSATSPASRGQRFAEIVLDSVSPSMVTTTSGPTVSVRGRVHNRSNRTLRDVDLRLERGDPVDAAGGLRRSLAVDNPPIAVASPFRRITDELAPGGDATFSVTLSLSGADGLRIDRTGVYPLQVNANAVPDYGTTAQVAGSRTLLPVLSLPPDADRAEQYAASADTGSEVPGLGADGSVSADTSAPSSMTLLWPVAAPPQLAPGVLGGRTEPVRLISEDLSRSLASGRLRSVLDPLREVVGDPGPSEGSSGSGSPGGGSSGSGSNESDDGYGPSDGTGSGSSPGARSGASAAPGSSGPAVPQQGSDLARSLCLAVDPDLLVTVHAMSLGYVVSTDPTDPTSPTVPGTGQGAAADWLDELRRIAGRMCVVALPFAQADLAGLARIGVPGLVDAALKSPADVVDTLLGVTSVRGLVIPAVGAVDDTGAALLRSADLPRMVTAASTVRPAGPTVGSGAYRIGSLTAQTFEQPVTAALAALGTSPDTPVLTPPDQVVDLSDESPVSRRQAAVGALAFGSIGAGRDPATSPGTTDGGESDGTPAAPLPVVGRSQLVMPSTYWSPTPEDATALLTTATVLLGAKATRPTPLPDLIGRMSANPGRGDLVDPPGIGPIAGRLPALSDVDAAAIRTQAELSWQLQGALVRSADVDSSPERYMAPLREDLMRSIRTPDELGAPTRSRLLRDRATTVSAVTSTLDRMRDAVRILDPGGRYTLASERSPLLLVVRNDLSLPVRVRINTTAPNDLEVGDIGGVEIPARGTRQIQLPTRAQSSEAITLTIAMDTVTGVTLGSPIKLSVHSNAYGKPLFIITLCAGVALVLLTARRLWHRFRGEPDPADADRPEAGEYERALAASTYQQRRRTLLNEASESQPEPPDPGTAARIHRTPTPEPRPEDDRTDEHRGQEHRTATSRPDDDPAPDHPAPDRPDDPEGTRHR